MIINKVPLFFAFQEPNQEKKVENILSVSIKYTTDHYHGFPKCTSPRVYQLILNDVHV